MKLFRIASVFSLSILATMLSAQTYQGRIVGSVTDASGAVVATVEATDESGSSYTLAYELGLVYRERPYVDFVEVVPTDG